ncbi:hypothetical protein DPMN_015222 [Dreissena polymorpha]|uniref:Uncharacterized protein n=1 Tax=Dreissena polymorpha TaxID=45954 RepID=A0A9D4S5D8_DREPO|nr:hypothetical protein DPMN_015222 [Dreissena polymorpha]
MANNSDGCKKGLPLDSLTHILSDDASTPPHGGDYDDDAIQQPEAGISRTKPETFQPEERQKEPKTYPNLAFLIYIIRQRTSRCPSL